MFCRPSGLEFYRPRHQLGTAPAVVTKSTTNSVDSICSIYGLFILLCRKVSVGSVESV